MEEQKNSEVLAKSLERLEKVLDRLEKVLDKTEMPASGERIEEERERARDERERVREEREREREQAREERAERPRGTDRPQTTKEYDLRDFTGIRAGGAFDEVEIVRGDTFSVSVTGEEELFRNLDVSKDGDTLRLRHSPHLGWMARLTRPRAKITLPVLKELKLSGACRGKVSGFNSTEDFKLELSGASSLSGDITTGNANFEMSGATHLTLSGSAKDAVIQASGANHADLREFSVHNAAIKLSGATNIGLKLDGRLDARLSGVSHLSYNGNPMMGDIRTSGASTLRKE